MIFLILMKAMLQICGIHIRSSLQKTSSSIMWQPYSPNENCYTQSGSVWLPYYGSRSTWTMMIRFRRSLAYITSNKYLLNRNTIHFFHIFAMWLCTLFVLFLIVTIMCNSFLPVGIIPLGFQVVSFYNDVISINNYLRKEDSHMNNTFSATLAFVAIPNWAM